MVLPGPRPLVEAGFLSGSGSSSLVIDATGMTDACPLDVTGIVATAHWAKASALDVTLVVPQDQTTAAYLQRMGVLDLMPSPRQIRGRIPTTDPSDRLAGVMQVRALNPGNFDDVAERLGLVVTEFYPDIAAARAAVFVACSELMGNATEHGNSPAGAFIAVQTYPETDMQGRRLEFAVCDTGIGVMRHLRQNPQHAHLTMDKLAIAKALEAGVSGIAADRRGNGLSDAIERSRSVGNVGLQIRSGRGEVRVMATPAGREQSLIDRPDQTSGTWAWLTHQLSRPVQTAVQP